MPLTEIRGLYVILDLPLRWGHELGALAEATIEGGAALLQLRAKGLVVEAQRACLRRLGPICLARGVPLFINDSVALALEGHPGVSGVHLGQGDLAGLGAQPRVGVATLREAGLKLGVSTHSVAQLEHAQRDLSPDYLAFGPVFSTETKVDCEPCVGLEALSLACARSQGPVVAIGGLDLERARAARQAGAAAVATISAVSAESLDEVRDRCAAMARAVA